MQLVRLKSNSGNILVITAVAMFIVTSATIGLLMITANALHLNGRQSASSMAFNAAESGAEEGALWLKSLPNPPNNSQPFTPSINSSLTLDNASHEVTIHPHPDNPTSFLKTFRIVSVGTAMGAAKTVEIIVKQASFGRYAYFTDKEVSSISNGAIWWRAGETIDGPAHSNNTGGTNFSINYVGSTAPIFLDMVTASGSTIDYNPSKPKNETTFKKVFKDGSNGYKLRVSPILLPASTDMQKEASWGLNSGFPGSNGVYLRADAEGGIYIQGDAAIELKLDVLGNQIVQITQGTKTTTVKLDKTYNTMTATGPVGAGSPSSTNSLGTGVIYCTGNITSLKGTIADNKVLGDEVETPSAFTIANDVNAKKTITITDNLVYKTKPDKTLPPENQVNLAAGTLGLVSKDIKISTSAPKNLEINAVMMAGGHNTTDGSFYAENYNTRAIGNLKVLGGIIQKARGPVGMFNSSTGKATSGYSKDYSYDPRLAKNPPPFFPTTGQYERLSWQVVANE